MNRLRSHYDEDESKDSSQSVYSTLGEKYNLHSNLPNPVPLESELTLLCAELAFWIYEAANPEIVIPKPAKFNNDNYGHWHYKKIVLSEKTQIAQWAFLQFSAEPKNAYLIFKGTDSDKVFGIIHIYIYCILAHLIKIILNTDIMADTAVIPMPIWCREMQKILISN